MWNESIDQTINSVTCPGCGLSCDDLSITFAGDQLLSLVNGCEKARNFYQTALDHSDPTPLLNGSPVTLDQALATCTTHLEQSNSSLFSGLATDVNGMRGILELADLCGATLDHMHGDAMFRNLRVLQDNGWFTTTFSEARNRADLVVLIGRQWLDRFPRLVERVLNPQDALFVQSKQRKIVILGPWTEESLPEDLVSLNPQLIPLEMDAVTDAIALIRGVIAGKPVDPNRIGKPTGELLISLANQLQQANYSVISWSAAEFDLPHAELSILGLVELAKTLNETRRSAALPLAGTLADITTNQVTTWQLGYPLRTRLQRGYPEHDPILNRWQGLISRGEVDLLVWTSALSPQALPPDCGIPTIVFGHPGMRFKSPPSVYIPVGIPGVDHHGHWYRSDGVCPLPLNKLRRSKLPSVDDLMNLLSRQLQSASGIAAGNLLC
ncbi:MAG: formylmethanofuran dehydrogenase subunit B [Candidatus Thiodiazotropha endolucinida]|nr:formylmethanofuran dehydrogenase subunit B [Candidatus Thiodiazotropha taylori]MCW4319722.1 formylmethanofuran dehydrogenase subunit B [Candidatus Thiodiazotropha taylori]